MKTDDQKPYTSKNKTILRTPMLLLIAVAIFITGIGIGNGKISVGNKSLFKTSSNSNSALPENLDYSSVESVYDSLRAQYDGKLETNKLLDGLKMGMVKSAGDPYTEYMNTTEAKAFNEQLTGSFSGIGAELSKEENTIIIVAPISGYPADKAGLKPRDVIASIDDKSAYDITVSDAVSQIRGPVGTKVKLKIVRDGKQALDFEITREQITIPSVESKIMDGNIGYIKVSRFSEDTAQLAAKVAQQFKSANVKGIILDVRSDPGGLLDAAVDVSSLWLPNGKTILKEKRDGIVIKTYPSKSIDQPILAGIPTVVLIDSGSASASEITAGALRDNNVATLMGVKSFGKGSVQQLVNLGDGSLLKVTIARWYTPNDRNIDKEGIEPDTRVERTEADFKANKDPQLDAAKAYLQK